MRGLYEPLHEAVGGLRRADIATLRPGSWESSHPETAPYFEEYRALLPERGRGVPLYRSRFAFEAFFLEPETADPALEGYLHGLLSGGPANGPTTVLKFCRSLGRVGWMERQFPAALHAVVLRDPLSQWGSGQRLLTEQRNRYFSVAPVLVLARNVRHPAVAQACSALGVSLPVLESPDMAYGVETVWRHLRQRSAAERYRAFLAYWTVTAAAAVRGTAMVIEPHRLAGDSGHREQVEAALGERLGTAPCLLSAGRTAGTERHELSDTDRDAAHAAAYGLLGELGGFLGADRRAVLLRCLERDERPSGSGGIGRPPPGLGVLVPASPHVAGSWRAARVAVEVLYARGLQPLRRLHGRVTRWRSRRRLGD